MLGVSHRLRKQKDIENLYTLGTKMYSPLVRIICTSTKNNKTRATVIVSKQVSKLAVERNVLKRRLRSCLKTLIPKLNASYDILVIVRPAAKYKTQADLGKVVDEMFKKEGMYVV